MNPFLQILIYILILFAIVMGISFVISLLATFIGIRMVDRASRKNAARLTPLLPGTDCGECGCESCAQYAQMVADERRELGKCPHLPQQALDTVNELFSAEPAKPKKLKDLLRKRNG